MILDNLRNTALYSLLGPRFAAAFAFLHKADFAILAPGRNAIIGDEVYALRVEGQTRPESECLWEAHLRYADIHYQVGGGEAIGYAPVHALRVTLPCMDGGDDILLAGTGRLFRLEPREFMVLFPADGHMTGVGDGVHSMSQKIVIKVLLGN